MKSLNTIAKQSPITSDHASKSDLQNGIPIAQHLGIAQRDCEKIFGLHTIR